MPTDQEGLVASTATSHLQEHAQSPYIFVGG